MLKKNHYERILWNDVLHHPLFEKLEIEKNDMNKPLNREENEVEFDDIYRIIEVPL